LSKKLRINACIPRRGIVGKGRENRLVHWGREIKGRKEGSRGGGTPPRDLGGPNKKEIDDSS